MRKNQLKKRKIDRQTHLRNRTWYTFRVLLGVFVLLSVSGLFIFIHDVFTQSGYFQARQIRISGQSRLSRQKILQIAGIETGVNILSVNLTTIRKRLLADPWIADATVHRKIPSELHIRIREEKPLAVLDVDDGNRFLINVDGDVFKRTKRSENIAFPQVEGLTALDLPVPGMPRSSAMKKVMTLFELASKSNSHLPVRNIHKVHLDHEIGATVIMDEGNRIIKFGFGNYREKVEALGHLMSRLRRVKRFADIKVIDLFDVDRIVITPVSHHSSE